MSRSAQQPETERSSGQTLVGSLPTPFLWKIAAIAATALIAGIVLLDVLTLVIRPLGVLLAGIVVALTLAPIVDFLERWLPRMVAVLLVYLFVMLAIVGFGLVIFPPVIAQTANLVENFPQYYADVQRWFARELGISVQRDMNQFAALAEPATDLLIRLPVAITAAGVEFIVGLFVSLYWLHCMPRVKRFVVSLFPPNQRERADDVLYLIGRRMGGYMRGVVITGVIVGAAVYIGLSILGVRYALLLALLAFLGEFFPNVGPVLAGIPAVIVALMDSPQQAVIVLIFYIVIQQIESYVILPLIMLHGQVHIPPLLTTFGVFTGFFVGGVLWAILAIPLSGAIMTLVTEVIAPAIRARYGESPAPNETAKETEEAQSQLREPGESAYPRSPTAG